MSSERFSLSEFSEYLDDSDGHRLAQFLQKKSGEVRPGGRRIFNSIPERFSLEVRLKRVSTPHKPPDDVIKEIVAENTNSEIAEAIQETNERKVNAVDLPECSAKTKSHSITKHANDELVCDPNTANNVCLPIQEQNNIKEMGVCVSSPGSAPNIQKTPQTQTSITAPSPREVTSEKEDKVVLPNQEPIVQPSSAQPLNREDGPSRCVSPLRPATLPPTPRSVRLLSPRSPMTNVARSGGVNSADRLRRQALKRRSTLANTGKRTLLKEFESTIKSPDFDPQICSTPMSQKPLQNLEINSPGGSHDTQRPSTNRLNKQDEAVMKSMIVEALEESMKRLKNLNNTERMQISLTPEQAANQPRLIENAHSRTITTPMSITNETLVPETQQLLQKAQAQISTNALANNKSHIPITQELLQEVQNTLQEIRKSHAQPSKIVIPVNQTFNSAPTTTKSQQSQVREAAENYVNPEHTLSSTMVRNNSASYMLDTLTPTHASRIYPDIQSITEATQQNASPVFVNHPTFTQSNTPTVETPIENISSKTKHGCSYSDKCAHAIRANTPQQSECRNPCGNSVHYSTFTKKAEQSVHSRACSYSDKCAHAIRANTPQQSECRNPCGNSTFTKEAEQSVHSRACIEQQQISTKHNSIHTNDFVLQSPRHSRHQSSVVSTQAQLSANAGARQQLREESFPRNNSMNASEAGTREHAQHECRTPEGAVIQHVAEPMKGNISHNRTNQHECTTPKRQNNTLVDKIAKSFTELECCSPTKSTVQDQREPSYSALRNSTIHKTPRHSIRQDPDKQLNSNHKSISFIDKPIYLADNTPPMNVNNQSLANDARPKRSILKNTNLSQRNVTINNNIEATNSSLITEDEDADESQIPNTKVRVTRKSGPLNLAPERRMPVTRSRRKRKHTLPSCSNAMVTTDTDDGETGLPPAHALNLRHTRHGEYILQKQKTKRPLNKPPNTPKNGEKFAEELKAHLARLTNHEILDLRKRNSIGEALIAPTRMRKSAVSIERALKQKLQIEEQIQLEILRRELLGEAEGLHEIAENNEEPLNEEPLNEDDVNTNKDDAGILDEFVNEFPSAPDVFKDNNNDASTRPTSQRDETVLNVANSSKDYNNIATTSQCDQMLMNVTANMQTYNSSLIDDNSTERVTFTQPNTTNSFQGRNSRSRKKKCEELPEITKKYIEIHKKIRKRRQPNISKRSLYSKGDSTTECDENECNLSSEKENCSQDAATINPIPPPPNFTPTRRLSNLHIPSPPPPMGTWHTPTKTGGTSSLPSPVFTTPCRKEQSTSTSTRKRSLPPPPTPFSSNSPPREPSSSPPPPPSSPALREFVLPPEPFLDNCNNTAASRVNAALKPLNSTQVASCQTDDEVFKKPIMPAPRRRVGRKRKVTENIETSSQQVESSETESTDDAEGVRRSKRGQVPRKQSFLCGTQNGPPLLYSLMAAVEKRSNKARLKRLEQKRRSGSLNSNISVPVACSTVKKAMQKRRGRPSKKNIIAEEERPMYSYLGDTNTTTGTVSSVKSMQYNIVKENRLQAIEEKSTECEGEMLPIENEAARPQGSDGETQTSSSTQTQVANNRTGTKPKTVEKNKKQKRKIKAKENQEISEESPTTGEVFDQLKRSASGSAADSTQRAVSSEEINKRPSGSNPNPKADQKIKKSRRKVNTKETQLPVLTASATAINIRDEVTGNQENSPQTTAINTQSEVDINEKASGSRKKSKKVVEKTNKQKRKIKTSKRQLPAQENTTSTTTPKDTITNVIENIADSQSENATCATNHTRLLERSHCNGPPPPPRDKLNEIFDQLKKNAVNNDEPHSEDSSSSSASRTRNVRVRLPRVNAMRNPTTTSSAESEASIQSAATSNRTTQNSAQNELYAWLRNVSHSAESTNAPDVEIFREMRASTAGNLYFTDLNGVDYAFYNTDDKSSLGYLRFQPRQHKPSKRAKKYSLHFVVLAGTFRFGTDNEHGVFGLGDMVAINIGKRYNITNMEDDIGILMVIKK